MTKQLKLLLSLCLVLALGGCSTPSEMDTTAINKQTGLSTENSDLGSLIQQESENITVEIEDFEGIKNYVRQNEAELNSDEIIYNFGNNPLANEDTIISGVNKKEKRILTDNLNEYNEVKTDSTKYKIKLSKDKNKLYIDYLDTDKKGIVVIEKDKASVIYKVEDSEFIALTNGDGIYNIKLYKTKSGITCTPVGKFEIEASNTSKNTVYSKQSYYSNYSSTDEKFNSLSEELWGKSENIVDYIWNCYIETAEYPYDYDKSTSITNGLLMRYRPNVADLVEEEKGICLDKSAVMASLLRAMDIPTKIVFGHYKEMYHAWVEVYYNNQWLMFDPTLKIDYSSKDIENYSISRYN